MTLHIGIVACSTEGAALCYRSISLEGAQMLGKHDHPDVSLHSHSLAKYMGHVYENDWAGVAELMLSSADKLARAGADFLICPDNTIHQAFDLIEFRSPRPWLHIAQEVANEARRSHFKRLGVLGTRYLMEGPVYSQKLAEAGIDWRIPQPADRAILNRIVFDGHGGAKSAERWNVGKRIRDVEEGPDGSLWMLEDANPGALIHVTPK